MLWANLSGALLGSLRSRYQLCFDRWLSKWRACAARFCSDGRHPKRRITMSMLQIA